ncbi:TDP-N-acetylfucosamine:lipid II N-acetylfucosaminyltransferase [Shewanella sp. 3_MG-2023]|uniref:TDP-N-acetylfucosamine:lipid II N-acetylfucosaminyltransferase n=1 Tax=Shewanella sp. 3_MG-2023 TaxID=3062635 RepID=UPI0026E2CC76|nr:TDP-N-acetylfucosamine:lipid II N-acetylfucosaminyltransferase [Shewanella sp. 3_MG-2023]MDO6776599.1 TDP-N-acetylfucosamine:lipid II N-acetylfucosaminyltransferase [Shewanella sp. 3_MG-2023]
MKFVHLVIDNKFTENIFNTFGKISYIENFYVCLEKKCDYKFLKTVSQIILYERTKYIEHVNHCDYVFIHSLNTVHVKFILENPSLNYVWIGMGYDYYDLMQKDLYYTYSKKWLTSNKGIKARIKSIIGLNFFRRNNKRKAVSKIKYFAPVLFSEFCIVNKIFHSLEFLSWNYGMSASILAKNIKLSSTANSLLLGNSADPCNNHFEILLKLSELNFSGKIYIPLSYGNERYKNELLRDLAHLNLDIVPLVDYVSKDEYFNILKECKVVIMNHTRQQAGSNIAVMLSMGAKVYINSESPFYDFYLSEGAFVYDTKNIKDISFFETLDDELVDVNLAVVNRHFSSKAILDKTEKVCQVLMASDVV